MHAWAKEEGEVSGGLSEGGNKGTKADYCGWRKVAPTINGT